MNNIGMEQSKIIDTTETYEAPRWDLMGTEGCGGGIRFLAPYLVVLGYVGIYRRKKYDGGATWGPRGWRARPVG